MIFIENKYTRTYFAIINKAQTRILLQDIYTEKHHIIPKSLGGNNSKPNLVILTSREHFIVHWLLTKMTNSNNKHKMLNALRMMRAENPSQTRYATKITSRVYANLKKGYIMPFEIRQKISQSNKGRISPNKGKQLSAEHKHKLSIATKNKSLTETHKQKIKESWKVREKMTKETKQKMSIAKKGKASPLKGKSQPDWLKQKWSQLRKGQNDGKRWFTNGTTSYLRIDCPTGCVPGRTKKL